MSTLDILGEDPEWIHLPSGFVVPEQRPKRTPGPINFDAFDEGQMKVVAELLEYMEKHGKFRMYTVTGYAGTGKTYIETRLVEYLIYTKKWRVAVTAPTNKAVDVAREMSEVADKALSFSTLHKLLGLKEHRDDFGRLYFLPDPNEPASLSTYNVLFIDEVSMLDDKLFEYVEQIVLDEGLKVIFIGDPMQIPPINRLDAIPLMIGKRNKHHIGHCGLTKIHRQAEGNPVLELATAIREHPNESYIPFDLKTDIRNNAGVIVKQRSERQILHHVCDVYFANDYFANYSDFFKVVAYRNKTANAVNAEVRKLIFKQQTLPAVMIGEKLLADEPIFDSAGYTIFSTNAEFEVKSYEVKTTRVRVFVKEAHVFTQEVKYYECTVFGTQMSNPRTFMKDKVIWIMHEDSAAEWNQSLELTKVVILRIPKEVRRWEWKNYYGAKNTFAQVKYNYAITAHKCQGSSYESNMVLDWDIKISPNVLERNRILYTAVTRTRKYLFIVKQ